MATRAWDILDRRVLAGVAFVDGRDRPVTCPIRLSVPDGVRFFWKRPGMLVVTEAPGLALHSAAFEVPPTVPALGSVRMDIDVKPASSAYAARRFELRLPRTRVPANPDSVFDMVPIRLTPTPAAPIDGLAAGLRVSVTRSDDGRVVEGALVRLRPVGGRPETSALTDAAGEAFLIAPAIPLATPGPGAVMLGDFEAALDAVVVPAQARFHTPDEVFAARRAADARVDGFIDPDTLAGAATLPTTIRIAAGQVRTAAIAWTPP
jgi:hypothetical protein